MPQKAKKGKSAKVPLFRVLTTAVGVVLVVLAAVFANRSIGLLLDQAEHPGGARIDLQANSPKVDWKKTQQQPAAALGSPSGSANGRLRIPHRWEQVPPRAAGVEGWPPLQQSQTQPQQPAFPQQPVSPPSGSRQPDVAGEEVGRGAGGEDAGQDASAGAGDSSWIFCAGQWQPCQCAGNVKWGNKDTWKVVPLPKGKKDHLVVCSIDKLGDSLPGDDGKHCLCEVKKGSNFAKTLNPGLMETTSARLATSCDIFRGAASSGSAEDAEQWKATEPFCTPGWNGDGQLPAGPRALAAAVLQGLMNSWIDARFDTVHQQFYAADGWTDRVFVNYYMGPPSGKHAAMTEQLIVSVHEFSTAPIVVFHFGTTTPSWWTKDRFPRLVLLHCRPMPATASRSFNFNKLRAMMLVRARVGIQLDSDQFVAPRVDAMFATTEREVTKEYGMPILPAHFLDRTPRDTGAYWERYCPKDKCKWQTARWGHAHPTWTFWAVAWIGKWLRGNLRDETLPVREDGSMKALRIMDVPEDEDLLNVATWEDGGKKQWCKLDLPGPSDFSALLRWREAKGKPVEGSACTSDCGDITADRKFHPYGVAKAFYTAHHAVDPAETAKYIKALKRKFEEGMLPPPIMYKGVFYGTGESLRRANPEVTCVI